MAAAQAQSPAPGQSGDSPVLLRGLLVSPSLSRHTSVPEDQMSAFTVGQQMQSEADGRLILTGDAQVRRLDSVVKGDRIEYDRNTGDVKVRGNGLIMRDASIVRGPELDYNLNSETGRIETPSFWLGASGGAGRARQADILSRSQMRLYDTIYSGCNCIEPSWYIKSSRVDLDFDENDGVARNGVLFFKGVPILASPYLRFPIRKERKSGFLTPIYGMSSKSGFEFALPYYFNLAPNYDATLTPRYLIKRGLQLGAEFRYLGERYSGQMTGTYLADDKQRNIKRWMYSLQHHQVLGGGFNALFDIRRVSDDDYFRDFSTLGLGESMESHLPSTAMLTWGGYRYFSAYLQAQTYQTLQDRDLTGPIYPQYNKLPELHLRAVRYAWGGFDVVSENTITRFNMPRYSGTIYPHWDPSWSGRRLGPDGTRASSYTSIAYPIVRAGWYVTPKVGIHASHYETDWYANELTQFAGRPRGQSRVLPIMSLDSGMTFERQTSLFGSPSVQTLEPRIYYLRIPYRDQSQLPVYDTSLASFNFAQAFDENIYSGGWDRIADANQLTVGLTTRWLDADTGFERLSLSAAQRIYFDDQRVFLYEDPRTSKRSDYLVGVNAALTNTFNLRFDAQFNPESRDRNRMAAGVRWEPKRLTTLSVAYRYERDPQLVRDPTLVLSPEDDRTKESITVAGQWPLTSKLYALGRFDYSLKEKRSTQSILGFEYKGDCCWTARVVAQRYAVSVKDVNTAVFFQLELTGLGALGTDPMSLLRRRVTGYQPVSDLIPEATTFERYE